MYVYIGIRNHLKSKQEKSPSIYSKRKLTQGVNGYR